MTNENISKPVKKVKKSSTDKEEKKKVTKDKEVKDVKIQNKKVDEKVQKKSEKKEQKEQKNTKKPQENVEEQTEHKQNRSTKHIDDFKKYFGKLISREGNKQKLIDQLMREFGTFLNKFALKKLPSKVIQQGIKLGDSRTKEKLINSMLKENFDEIIKSKYGRFLAKKCIKYGTKEQKARIFKILADGLMSLIGHPEGCQVLDYFMKNAASPHQLTLIKSKLKLENLRSEGKKNQKDEIEQTEELENLAVKLIEKELYYSPLQAMIINQAFSLLVEQEQTKVVETLKDKLFDVSTSKEGCQLAITLINNNDNKFRKNLIKITKGRTVEFMNDELVFKSHMIMKLLNSVDDTKLLNKTILKEIGTQIGDVFMNANGCKILFNLFTQQLNSLKIFEISPNLFSKKDPETRNNEIIQQLQTPLVEYLMKNLNGEMLSSFQQSRIIQALLKQIIADENSEHVELINKVLGLFTQEIQKNFTQLFDQPDSIRVLKLIITLAKDNAAVDKQLESLVDAFSTNSKNTLKYLESKAVFIFVALVENTSHKKNIIKLVKKEINNVKDKSKAGVQILLKHI